MKRVGFPALSSALLFLVGACRLTGEKGQGSAARAAPLVPSGWRGGRSRVTIAIRRREEPQ